MKLKHDHMLAQLCHFGFRCEEKTADGFLRYSRSFNYGCEWSI